MPAKTEDFSAFQLDAIDIAILKELQKNARLTLKELALSVNLSTTPVFERWKRLEQLGFISKYVTVLNPELLHQSFTAYCMVKLRRLNLGLANKFEQSAAALAEVTECYQISGDHDYMLKIQVPSIKAYKEFVLNVLVPLDLVGSIESHFVMDIIKQSYELPIR